jgi:putative endopeptidase
MSDATKAKAFAKLDSIINKIGYPDSWRDYSKLEVRPGAFVSNLLLANQFENRRVLKKIGQPTVRSGC